MNDLPYFPFYPADYLTDEKVKLMSLQAEGCYIRLLCHQWQHGSIPADRLAIVLLCKANDGSAIDEALKCFQKLSRHPGRLINKRLDTERRKLESFRKAKQNAGVRGADVRWHSHNSPLAKNGSSSSSSYSYKKDKKEGGELPPIPKNTAFEIKDNLENLRVEILESQSIAANEKLRQMSGMSQKEICGKIEKLMTRYIGIVKELEEGRRA